MSEFKEMVERVGAWRAEHGGVPLLDDTEVLGDFDFWPDEFDWDREVDAEDVYWDLLPPDSGDSPPERFVVLSSAWRQMRWVWMEASPETVRRKRDTYRTAMRAIAEQRPPDACVDATDCQWEMVVAAELEMWDRVEALSARWRRLGPEAAERANLGLARLFVTSVLVSADHRLPELWLDYPCTTKQLSAGAALVLYYSAITVGGSPENRLEWRVPAALTQADARRLYIASDAFQRAEAEGARLDTLARALSAWTDAVVGMRTTSVERLRKSLASMRELSKAEAVGAEHDGHSRKALLLSQVRLAAWAHDYAASLEAAESLTDVSSSDPWAWELVAQIRRRLGDEHGWVDAYNQFIALSPQLSEDWERNELLLLGFRHREGVRLADMVAAAPALQSDLDVTEPLLALEWPAFLELGPEARERWLTALTHLCNPRVATAQGDLRWAIAAEAAGEAVASQLRTVVIAPFRSWLETKGKLRELDQIRGAEGQLARALRSGSVTMGSIVLLLEAARNQSGSLGPLLNGWLDTRDGRWAVFVRDSQALVRLDELTKVRNPATHELMSAITKTNALEIYRGARMFLTDLMQLSQLTPEPLNSQSEKRA